MSLTANLDDEQFQAITFLNLVTPLKKLGSSFPPQQVSDIKEGA